MCIRDRVDHGFERAAIGDAAFDAFGDKFAEAVAAAVALAVDDALVVVVDVEVVGALEVALEMCIRDRRYRPLQASRCSTKRTAT